MSMDQHCFTESWKDIKGCSGAQELCYSTTGWGSGQSSPSASSQVNGNVDKELYKSLVEMLPLVESFMDQRVNRSFSHYASPIYTPTPRDWSSRKMPEQKGKKSLETTRATKQREPKEAPLLNHCKNIDTENGECLSDDLSICSSRSLAPDGQHTGNGSKTETLSSENREDLLQLQNQIEELEKKLAEKDELLKSAENSIRQINSMQLQKVEELQQQVHEKDNLIKSAHIQLYDKKNELADLQSLLAKAQEDAKASNQKAQKVEEDLEGLRRQIAALILFFETAEQKAADSDMEGIKSSEDLEMDPNFSMQDSDPNGLRKESVEHEQHNVSCQPDKTEVEDIEQARRMYLAAVIAAKNNPGEESLSLAADLRLQLQQFLLRPALANTLDDQLSVQALGFTAA